MKSVRAAQHRLVFALGLLMMATASVHGQEAASSIGQAALKSPYLGSKESFRLPLEGKPTLVVMLELGQSLVPMELIRCARATSGLDGKANLAVVFVGSRQEGPAAIDATLEQLGILSAGLRRTANIRHLVDPDRKLWSVLGKPRLPYVVLVAPDGALSGEDLFGAAYEVDRERLAACVENRAFDPRRFAPDDAPTAHPFYLASIEARPLAHTDDRDYRVEWSRRLNARAVIAAMLAHDRALATRTIEAYIDTTFNFTLAEAFAKELVSKVGADAAPRASKFLLSEATGYVFVTPYRDDVMVQLANASPTLDMHVTLTAKLLSRWDDRPLGQVTRALRLHPLSSLYTSDRMFESLLAGWGDYRATVTVEVTMSSGEYPDTSYRPMLTRTMEHDFLFVPRNESAHDESEFPRDADDSLRAFRAGLSDALREISRQTRDSGKSTTTWSTSMSSAVGAAISRLVTRNSAPQLEAAARPFPSLKVARWVQGVDLCTPTEVDGVISGFRGKVVLLDFMFVDCPPCRAMLPSLSKLQERYKDRGLAVLSVAPDWGSKGLRSLIERKGLTHAFLEMPAAEEKRWGVSSFPTLFVIDRNGVIRATLVGTEPEVSFIERLLDECPTQR